MEAVEYPETADKLPSNTTCTFNIYSLQTQTGWFISYFLFFRPWSLEIRQMDLRFGFYVKFPPQNRAQKSGNRNPGSKIKIFGFVIEVSFLHFLVSLKDIRSLSCIGSSGRLVGRISPKFRPNAWEPFRVLTVSGDHVCPLSVSRALYNSYL